MRSAFSMIIRLAFGTSTPTSMTVVATSRSRSPALERAHHGVLAAAGHATVHEPDADAGQGGGERRGSLLGGLVAHAFGFVDQRADPVRLAPRAAGGVDACHHFVAPCVGQHHGADRRAAGRQLVDDRDVEVGVGRHRQRARDRRGGHDELVREATVGATLFPQLHALVHAEAVLLVDDHEHEPVEGHALLEQRVRADRDLHRRRPRGPG